MHSDVPLISGRKIKSSRGLSAYSRCVGDSSRRHLLIAMIKFRIGLIDFCPVMDRILGVRRRERAGVLVRSASEGQGLSRIILLTDTALSRVT